MSNEENDFVCSRTLQKDGYGKVIDVPCKECCLHCPKKNKCQIACILIETDLKDCPECISKRGFMVGEIFSKPQ